MICKGGMTNTSLTTLNTAPQPDAVGSDRQDCRHLHKTAKKIQSPQLPRDVTSRSLLEIKMNLTL